MVIMAHFLFVWLGIVLALTEQEMDVVELEVDNNVLHHSIVGLITVT